MKKTILFLCLFVSIFTFGQDTIKTIKISAFKQRMQFKDSDYFLINWDSAGVPKTRTVRGWVVKNYMDSGLVIYGYMRINDSNVFQGGYATPKFVINQIGDSANNMVRKKDSIGSVYTIPGTTQTQYLTNFSRGQINVTDKPFNAKGDGVTNDSLPFVKALAYANTSGLPVYIPSGTYIVTSVALPSNVMITGAGYKTILMSTSSARAAGKSIFTSNHGEYIRLYDLTFKGRSGIGENSFLTDTVTIKDSNSNALTFTNGFIRGIIYHCDFINLNGRAISSSDNSTNAGDSAHNDIVGGGCHFHGNYCSVLLTPRSEYWSITDNFMWCNTHQVWFYSGNVDVSHNQINDGYWGVQVLAGANDSHGQVCHNRINHNIWDLSVGPIQNDEIIDNNDIYGGSIDLNYLRRNVSYVGFDFSHNNLGLTSADTLFVSGNGYFITINYNTTTNPSPNVIYDGTNQSDCHEFGNLAGGANNPWKIFGTGTQTIFGTTTFQQPASSSAVIVNAPANSHPSIAWGDGGTLDGNITWNGANNMLYGDRSTAGWDFRTNAVQRMFITANTGNLIVQPAGGTFTDNGNALQVTGSLSVSNGIIGKSSTPSISAGAGAGSGILSPVVSDTGTNVSGTIVVTTGTTTVAGIVCTITLANSLSFTNGCSVELTPANATTALLSGATMVYISASKGQFNINSGASAITGAGTTYAWKYTVIGY